MSSRLVILALISASFCSSFMAPRLLSPACSAASRSAQPAMMWRGAKGVPKGKVPEATKGDDKSWGLYAWLSDTIGGGSEAPDTGPQFGKNAGQKGLDANGNFKGDRRVISKRKKTANEGAKFNPLDASTW